MTEVPSKTVRFDGGAVTLYRDGNIMVRHASPGLTLVFTIDDEQAAEVRRLLSEPVP